MPRPLELWIARLIVPFISQRSAEGILKNAAHQCLPLVTITVDTAHDHSRHTRGFTNPLGRLPVNTSMMFSAASRSIASRTLRTP